jgi:GDPmannose 4,6-dehydratase
VAHSVRELVEIAFSHVGLDWRRHVLEDPRFIRPAEVDLLLADPARAKAELGWVPRVPFEAMIRTMVDEDLRRLSPRR